MSITQGDPLPNVTVTTTKTDTAPDYYTDYLKDLAKTGETALGRTAAQGIAGYDPLQTQGYGMVENRAGSYADYLKDAKSTAGEAAAGLDTARIAALMDPYRTNVVDEMSRLAQQNIQRNVLPSLKAGFVGRGDLGSSRYAGALGQSLADIQANLTGQQYGALSKGYGEAVRAALDELGIQNQAARTQMELGKTSQELGLTEAGALTKAGAEKQAYEQAKLDYPLKTAQQVSGLMRGLQMPMTQGETRTGPLSRDYYAQSDLSNVMGILSLIGSASGGAGLDKVLGAGSKFMDYIKGVSSGNMTIGGDFVVDPSEFVGQNEAGIPVYYDSSTGSYYDTSGKMVPVTGD